jgi:hypothetical protein
MLKSQSIPRRKHSVSVIKPNQLMVCREIIAVCSEIHTKHTNTLCGQNVEFVNVTPGGVQAVKCMSLCMMQRRNIVNP